MLPCRSADKTGTRFASAAIAVKKKRKKIRIGLFAVLAVVLGALALLIIVAKKNDPLDAEELTIKLQDLQSFAAERELVAQQAQAGHLPANYFHVQTSMLQDKTDETTRALAANR